MPRPKIHDDALRLRLLEQAVRMLSENGPEGLSLRKLAAQVDTSTTAVYSLFGGKPGLLDAVFAEAFARFGQQLSGAKITGEQSEDLLALALAYRESALREPHFYQVMFGPAGSAVTPSPEARRRADTTFRPLVDAVRRAIDDGLFREENPTTIASSLWATVHGLVSLELRSLLPPDAGTPEQVFRKTVLAVADGWRPRK